MDFLQAENLVIISGKTTFYNLKYSDLSSVKEIVIHPEWAKEALRNDIALLKLESPIKLSSKVGIVCLPDPKITDISGKMAVVAGW